MDYMEAVKLARAGDERGYHFLYDATYQSKFYLALQYMKNREAAKDVMQEAYLRAFSRLDMLEEPAAFAGWFGRIVVNIAKNMCRQRHPILFSDMELSEEEMAYQIEDDNILNQPESAFARLETEELAQEWMQVLSEEQRQCISLFYIEGLSIRRIAATLHCSENTVKSRLNYGRKNLRIKAKAFYAFDA